MAEFAIVPLGHGGHHVTIDTDNIFDTEDLDFELDRKIKGRFEEYEVQYLDGDVEEADIWHAINDPYYGGLAAFVKIMNEYEKYELPAVFAGLDHQNYNVDDIGEYVQESPVRPGTLEDMAYEYVEEGLIDKSKYFDYEALARDLQINLELPEEAYDEEDGGQLWNDSEVMDYVYDLVDDIGTDGFNVDYVDYDAIKRDLEMDHEEFTFANEDFVSRSI